MLSAQAAPATLPKAVIELIYAANAIARRMVITHRNGAFCLACAAKLSSSFDVPVHHDSCPVGRFYAAVEAAGSAEQA